MDATFVAIEGFRGEARWYSRGEHYYVVARERRATITLRCASANCRARWLLKNGQAQPAISEHSHPPTPWIPSRNAMFQSLKRRAATENITLNEIYEDEANRHPDAASHLLWDQVAPSMRKWRRQQQPAVPRSLAEFAASLAVHPRHSNMLVATVTAGDATSVILAQSGFGNCLGGSETIVIDGTFLTVPAGIPAAQVLTVHGVINGHFFHPVVVLMENRTRALYEATFARLWQSAGSPHPANVVTDFESALQSAVGSVAGVQVTGCLFHYTQALLRRARALGICVRHNTSGWRLVRLYGTLALLPPAQIALGLAELQGVAEQQGVQFSEPLHAYFISQWMIRVGPDTFSVYGRPHQTSNCAESFHASLRRSLGASPNVWRFCDVIRQKFDVSVARLEALRAGRLTRRNRERNIFKTNVELRNRRALERGIISLREYIAATSHLIDVGDGVVDENVPEVGVEVEVAPEQHDQEELPLEMFPEVALQEVQVERLAPAPAAPQPQEPSRPRCGICTDGMATSALVPCGHTICADCYSQLEGNACPYCRSDIRESLRLYFA